MKRILFLVAGVVLVLGIGAWLVFGLGNGPKTYTVEITSNVEQIEYESKNNCRLGDNVTIEAIPLDGYRFIGWEVNGVIISEDVEYEITLTQENVNNVYKAVYKQEFTIYAGEVQNGNVASNVTKAIEGETITLTITPNDYYAFESAYYILDSETEHIAITNQTFTMPNGNVTVYANFQAIEYTITSAELEHGTLSFLPTVGTYGIEIVVTVTPEEDYELSPGTLYYATENIANGEITYSNNTYKFTMPGEDVTVYATFIKTVYGLSVSYGIQNGSVTIDDNKTKARMGSTVTLTVTPAVGYELETLYYTTNTIANGEITNNIFEMPGEDVTVYATFVKTDYNVNLSYNNQQGTVTTNRETAQIGDEITLTITPETGYQISGLYYTKSGSSAHVGITNNTFNMPASSVTIHVTFQARQYDISTQTSNGTFNDLPNTGTFGNTITFTLSPNTGYKLTDNSVYYTTDTTPNGVITNNSGTYSFTMPAGAVTVHAQFELQTFQVTLPEEKIGYSILNTNDNNNYTPGTVTYGSSISFRVVKDVAYSESQVTVTSNTGSVSSQDETYTISNITTNLIITITPLTINTYTVTLPETQTGYEIKTAEDGTFTTTTVEYGQDLSFKVALKTGYTNSTITVRNNGTIINLTEGIYTISNVTSNISIAVEGVTANAYTLTSVAAEVTVNRGNDTLNQGDTIYYDETLTLSSTPSEGMDAVYTINDTVIEGNTFTVTGNITIEYSEVEHIGLESEYTTLSFSYNSIYKTATVSANMSNMPTGNLKLPSKIINGQIYTITQVGSFSGCAGLTGIIVPSTVTTINASAFSGCSALESMILPFVGGSVKTATQTYQYPLGYIFGATPYEGSTNVTQYYYGSSTSSTTYPTYRIPSSLRSVTITGGNILRGAFYNCSMLTNITIPEGVTSIEPYAFYGCAGLTSITIPEVVTSIGSAAFKNCSNLREIEIPAVVTSISGSVFSGCSNLREIEIPAGVTSIGSSAFSGCSNLREIEIPAGITSVDSHTFFGCSRLTNITIPENVTSIGSSAFSGCSSLESMTLPIIGYSATVTSASTSTLFGYIFGTSGYDGGMAVEQKYGSSTSNKITYYIPLSLRSLTITGGSILYGALYGCSMLTDITILDGVITIGPSAFCNCFSLLNIKIPSSLTSIEPNAFGGCYALVEVCNDSPLNITSGSTDNGNIACYAKMVYGSNDGYQTRIVKDDVNGVAYYMYGSEYIALTCYDKTKTTVSLNEMTTEINQFAFYKCNNLVNASILAGVTSIGRSAFSDCGLTNITIPASVTSIGSYAFCDCDSLITVTFGDGSQLTNIGDYAFHSCGSLTTVTFGDNSYLTDIGDNAFSYCGCLTSITIPAGVTRLSYSAFSACYALAEIYNKSSLNITPGSAYARDSKYVCGPGGTYQTRIVKDDVNGVAYYVYGADYIALTCYDKTMTNVTLNENTTQINQFTFMNCSGLASITVPASVTTVGYNAFLYCDNLSAVVISSLSAWASISFETYSSTNPLYYANKLYLGSVSPENEITEINDLGNITEIKAYTFQYCKSITSITIPSSVTNIGYQAFSNCSNLSSVVISDLSAWASISFGSADANPLYYAKKLYQGSVSPENEITEINNLGNITEIKAYAFYNAQNITSATIPSSITSIGSYAFSGCSGLTSITIPAGVTSIGSQAFYCCSSLANVTFENTGGWFVASSSTATSGTDVTLTDPSTNATYLKTTYYNKYWKRNV